MGADSHHLGLFEGYGIELEYMIVDARTLDPLPISDRVLAAEYGSVVNEVERNEFAWSNELACHVIELKNNGPTPRLAGLGEGFAREVARVEEHLAPLGARLLPTAMHPWMNPARDFKIWPHGDRTIYEAFDRIFDCRGHGWSNLQSTHLNLPFARDDEFGRLHGAIRALLPVLPALSASSPFVNEQHTGTLDTRLAVYRSNSKRVPSVTGSVIPEPVFNRADYESLLERIYADLAPFDPEGILRHEWVNARGCIARFDRMAIEIRLLDVQECPQADLAIAAAVSRVLQALCSAESTQQRRIRELETNRLASILAQTIASAESAQIVDREYLSALGIEGASASAAQVWRVLVDRHVAVDPSVAEYIPALEVILQEGCLAGRILRRVGREPTHDELAGVYHELAQCLRGGTLFRAEA